jgi:hypothetical protein
LILIRKHALLWSLLKKNKKLNLRDIDIQEGITKEDFVKYYLQKQKPVVIKNASKNWIAYEKWSLNYMKDITGDRKVPLYDNRPIEAKNFNQPHAFMSMHEYVALLKKGPTNYRIFLWNILKEIPSLQSDFEYPDLGVSFLKKLPTLFFGGYNSYTFMHYDIDLANIFHFHFEGKKECILFDQSQSRYLYKLPNTLRTHHAIDFSNPDLETWSDLKKANGYIAKLSHGDMLYIPEGYWHYMKYITPGFSMSLRSIPKTPKNFLKALYNILIMIPIENIMRRTLGKKWIDKKNKEATKNVL